MKFSLLLKLSFALIVVCLIGSYGYAQNTISGTVRYSDDNTPVTAGIVKAFDLNGNYVAFASIQSNGTYSIGGLGGVQYDLIGVPNIEGEVQDFPPTGYPSTIITNSIVPILAQGIVMNKDIYVQRIIKPLSAHGSDISGTVSESNNSVSNAFIYATIENKVFGYAITNKNGDYKIKNLPEGDYILVVSRISDNSSFQNVYLDSKGLDNININLEPLKKNKDIAANSVVFNLKQNYPNPFNPSTLISYTIPKDANVNIKVYNSLGEVVSELLNADQKAGAYSVKFDGTNLSSGIYFYKLSSGSYVDTKRMVLIK